VLTSYTFAVAFYRQANGDEHYDRLVAAVFATKAASWKMQSKCLRAIRRSAPMLFSVIGSTAWATTYPVGPGKTFATPEHIVWSSIHPGDTIVIYPGTYPSLLGTGNSMLVRGVVGTAANPITIQGSSATNLPVLNAGISIDGGSQYINISNLDVSRNPSTQQYAAIIVQGGSGNIVLSGLNVHNSFVGVQVTLAGLQNTLQNSQIFDNVMDGITPGPPSTSFVPDANHRSYILNNSVHDNGAHGIEVTGPFWNVQKNKITHNGVSVSGTSGIHVYSTTDVTGTYSCNNNQIAYNYVTTQQDPNGVDGNGIQIDDFCDYNTVAFNVVTGNAGAGVSVLDAEGNVIVANTSYSNATDTGRVAKFPGVFRGELILGSMASLCTNSNVLASQCNVAGGRSSGNIVYDNIIVSGQLSVPGVLVSPDAAVRNTNYLYPNLYYNLGSNSTGVQLLWDDVPYYTANTIDAVTGQASRGGGNLVELPYFVNAAAADSDGLNLSKKPSNEGWVIKPSVTDMLGAMPATGISYYGAYYKSP
jgi:hypothetical protein